MFPLILSSPLRVGVVPSCDCTLPSWLNGYALTTKESSTLDLHHVDKAIFVGGNLGCSKNSSQTIVVGSIGKNPPSYVGDVDGSSCRFDFSPSVAYLGPLHKAELDERWISLELIAQGLQTQSYSSNNARKPSYLVKAIEQGGSYDQGVSGCHETIDMSSIRAEGNLQGEDDGHTLIVVKGRGTICLDSTETGRQFGASILAPYAHVETTESVGYVDGFIIARSAHLRGSGTQLHGDAFHYSRQMICRAYEVCGFVSPSSTPTTIPTMTPNAHPSGSPSAMPTVSLAPTGSPSFTEAPECMEILWVSTFNYSSNDSYILGLDDDHREIAFARDGTLYVVATDDDNGNAFVLAISPTDGSPKWVYQIADTNVSSTRQDSTDTSVTLDDQGILYVGSKNYFRAIFPDGTLKWEYLDSGEYFRFSAIAPDGNVVVGTDGIGIFKFNSDDGTKLWEFEADGDVYGFPVLDSAGDIYFGTEKDTFYAITADGNLKWNYTNAMNDYDSSPALSPDENTVYIGNDDGRVYAINTATGVVEWDYDTLDRVDAGILVGTQGVSKGTIFAGNDLDTLFALNSDGSLKWSWNNFDQTIDQNRSKPTDMESRPVLSNDGAILFVMTENSILYQLNASSGVPLNGYFFERNFWADIDGPLSANRNKTRFAFGTDDGQLIYLQAPNTIDCPVVVNFSVSALNVNYSVP